jgi:hypothetical protein
MTHDLGTAAPIDLDLDVDESTDPVRDAEAGEQTNGEDADVTVSDNTAQGCESTGEFCEDPRSSPSRLTSVTGATANTVAWSTLYGAQTASAVTQNINAIRNYFGTT